MGGHPDSTSVPGIEASTGSLGHGYRGGLDLKDDAVLATMGPSQRDADYVPSVLCLSCETLMIITLNPGAVIGVNHSAGNQATMRNQ